MLHNLDGVCGASARLPSSPMQPQATGGKCMSADRAHQPDHDAPPAGTTEIPWLSVTVNRPAAGVAVVCVVGEIDIGTEAGLQDQLSRVLATGPDCLVIDLSGVSFLGAAGLSVLLRARKAATDQGTTLQLRVPNPSVAIRPLQMSGLDGQFEIISPGCHPDRPVSRRPQTPAGLAQPGEPDHDRVQTATRPKLGAESEPDEYAHLVPLQWRYAQLTADDPERPRLRAQLITGHLPVAEHLARRFAGRGQPQEDLNQVATLGLINAVDRFEPARGSHFLAFAVPTITGELRRYFRDHGWSTHVPRHLKDLNLAIKTAAGQLSQQRGHSPRPSDIADHLGVATSRVLDALHAAEAYHSSSLDQLLDPEDTVVTHPKFLGELDTQLGLVDDRETLRPLLAQLAPRERTILALRFFHQRTQLQIAQQVGLSQMHVSRLLSRILAFLRQGMASAD